MGISALQGRHGRRGRRWLSSCLIALALVASACGNDEDDAGAPADETEAPADTAGADQTEAEAYYAELAGQSSDERRERLISDARAAGPLIVYTADVFGESLAEVFSEEFDIETDIFRAPSEEMLQRVVQEARAGRLRAGIHISDTAAMNALNDEGILAPYEPGMLDGLIDDAGQANWIATQRFLVLPAWNTDLVDEGELPADLADFANEAWSGRLAAELGDYDWYFTLYQHYLDEGMSEDEVQSLFDSLLADAAPVQGHSAATELLTAGQHDIVLTTFSVLNDRFIGDGAPIAYTREDGMPIGPVVAKYVGFGIGREASNPAAALLWADWMVTDGLAAARELGIATTASEDSGVPDEWEVLPVPEEDLAADRARWQQEYVAYLQ